METTQLKGGHLIGTKKKKSHSRSIAVAATKNKISERYKSELQSVHSNRFYEKKVASPVSFKR